MCFKPLLKYSRTTVNDVGTPIYVLKKWHRRNAIFLVQVAHLYSDLTTIVTSIRNPS